MFYAHEGAAADNAFTLGIDNKPVRVFRAFTTKKQREAYREKVWPQNNLIDCDRKMVEKYLTRQFETHLTGQGDSYLCARRDERDHYHYEIDESHVS